MGRLRVNVGVCVVCAVAWIATAKAQLFVPAGVRFGSSARSKIRVFQSPNALYEVSIEDAPAATASGNPEVTLIATLSKVEGNLRDRLWSTNFQGWSAQFLAPEDVFVSNKGDFFVVRRGMRGEVTLHRKEQSFSLYRGVYSVDGPFLSSPQEIVSVDELDGQDIVRLWDRDKNLWWAYRTSNGEGIDLKQRPDVTAKWNEATRKEILDRMYAARRETLRRKVAKQSAPLAKIAATAMGQSTNVVVSEGDYEFLTQLRNPEDRKWIEALMDFEDDLLGGFNPIFGPNPAAAEYIQTDYVRARADWLLGIWDNKVKPGLVARPQFRNAEDDLPRFTLGKVTGKIVFAGPINLYTTSRLPTPPAWTGPTAHVRLIPLGKAMAKTRERTDEIEHPLWGAPNRNDDLVEEATFAFTTVKPGRYQLKAVWDKRAPFSADGSAGPGDYESALSAPLEVTAGGVISNIVLYCTNRIGGGEPYYRSDDALMRKLRETGEVSQFSFVPDQEGRQDLFWRKAKFWIVATNAPANTNFAQLESIGTTTYGSMRGTDIPRPDCLDLLFTRANQKVPGPADLIIFDEHGCPYHSVFNFERPRSIRYTFFQFPRSAKTWRVVGYSQPHYNNSPTYYTVFDYTLTNLVQTARAELTAMKLPIEVDLGAVKMKALAVSQDYLEPHIEAKFYERDQPLMDWFVREAVAMDAEGNVMNPREMCRQAKSFRVVGRAGRNEPRTVVPFEFVAPREIRK